MMHKIAEGFDNSQESGVIDLGQLIDVNRSYQLRPFLRDRDR